jgi:queuosine precursor transporter
VTPHANLPNPGAARPSRDPVPEPAAAPPVRGPVPKPAPLRYSMWFVAIAALFVTTLIVSNVIAVKIVQVFGLVLPAAVVVFPISYIAGDVLTEVYGYARARLVIWIAFACNLVAVAAIVIGGLLPAAPFWQDHGAYQAILGYAPRLLAASFLAYFVGEFANAYVLARMKVATRGRWLWARTIGSTLVGQGLDSLVFLGLAFAGTVPTAALGGMIVTQWLFKTAYEALATPVTYAVTRHLKRVEGVDVYDTDTDFRPVVFGPPRT